MAIGRPGVLSKVRGYFGTRIDPLTSLFLVLPMFVLYQLGTLARMQCDAAGCRFTTNGVDLFTGTVLALTHGSRAAYAGVTLVVAVALVAGIQWARRRAKLSPKLIVPVLIESAVYASLVSPAVFAMQHLIGLGAPGSGSYFGDVVMSFGAGLYEELVFRAGIFAGLFFLLRRHWRGAFAFAAAALVSSLLFSAVHHIGPLGEPFTARAFVFRAFAGLVFATVYRVRGFAIAAYTHCLYDVWVFTLQRA